MPISALLLATLVAQSPPTATRYDLGERVKKLDLAWIKTTDRERRSKAVVKISESVTAFFTNKYSAACQSLDQARHELLGLKPEAWDALSIRFVPPIVEPGSKANLVVHWAYIPTGISAVELEIQGKLHSIKMGEGLTLPVDVKMPHFGDSYVSIPITISGKNGVVNLNIAENSESRINKLAESEIETVRISGEFLKSALDGQQESEASLIQYLQFAEKLNSGVKPNTIVGEFPLVKHSGTVFRAWIGASAKASNTVVVALHGAGGSENMFFESYGSGSAVSEAQKRGWMFVSPRTSNRAVTDVLAWLKESQGITPKNVFILGHSMGGGAALGSGTAAANPTAIVAFAPAANAVPKELENTPIMVGVGKQEIMMLSGMIKRLTQLLEKRPNFKYVEYDPCEHLMVVVDGIKDAYKFFDQYKK